MERKKAKVTKCKARRLSILFWEILGLKNQARLLRGKLITSHLVALTFALNMRAFESERMPYKVGKSEREKNLKNVSFGCYCTDCCRLPATAPLHLISSRSKLKRRKDYRNPKKAKNLCESFSALSFEIFYSTGILRFFVTFDSIHFFVSAGSVIFGLRFRLQGQERRVVIKIKFKAFSRALL